MFEVTPGIPVETPLSTQKDRRDRSGREPILRGSDDGHAAVESAGASRLLAGLFFAIFSHDSTAHGFDGSSREAVRERTLPLLHWTRAMAVP